MKKLCYENLMLMLMAASLLTAFAPAAKATITCSSWNSGSYSGNNIYNCNFSSGSTGRSYNNSYYCIDQTHKDYCTIKYNSRGNSYSGPCTIVFKCYNGQSYYCDINDWDGKETINCRYIPSGCKEIDICTPTTTVIPKSGGSSTSVPEPSTVIAAVLLLIPFGISTARILRKQKALFKN